MAEMVRPVSASTSEKRSIAPPAPPPPPPPRSMLDRDGDGRPLPIPVPPPPPTSGAASAIPAELKQAASAIEPFVEESLGESSTGVKTLEVEESQALAGKVSNSEMSGGKAQNVVETSEVDVPPVDVKSESQTVGADIAAGDEPAALVGGKGVVPAEGILEPSVAPLQAPVVSELVPIRNETSTEDEVQPELPRDEMDPPDQVNKVVNLGDDASMVLESGFAVGGEAEPLDDLMLDEEGQIRKDETEQDVVNELLKLEDSNPRQTRVNITKGKLQASKTFRATTKLGHDAKNKAGDVLFAAHKLVDSTADITKKTGAMAGGVALSVSSTVGSTTPNAGNAFSLPSRDPVIMETRGPDTVTKVDVIGTALKDIATVTAQQRAVGANSADSPLNTPFILFLAPILPLGIMYTVTVLRTIWPTLKVLGLLALSFLSFRLIFGGGILIFLAVALNWSTLRGIDALKPITLQVDKQLDIAYDVYYQKRKQLDPKIDGGIDKVLDALSRIDEPLAPKIGFSLVDSFRALIHGWKHDPLVGEVAMDEYTSAGFRAISAPRALTSPASMEVDYERFFNVELQLHKICDFHRGYSSAWVEWHEGNVIASSVPIRDVEGHPKNFVDYSDIYVSLEHEVLMTYHPRIEGDSLVDKLDDFPIRLVVKARKELPIYCNDGARRYHESRNDVFIVGEIILSAKKIGVGSNQGHRVETMLRIPIHVVGYKGMRTATIHATAKIKPVSSSSYSYRESLSTLPSGDWTVRVNIIELRNLHGTDASGSSDPFVEVETLGQMKATHALRKTLACVINDMLYFTSEMSGAEVEKNQLIVSVKDWNRFGGSTLIGKVQFDVKSIYTEKGSEILRRWYALTNPDSHGPQGYVKLSVTVVGPGLVPRAHADAEDEEEFQRANLLKNLVVCPPPMSVQDWVVHLCVGWADMLPRMSEGSKDAIRGFMELHYTGFPSVAGETFIAEARRIVDPSLEDNCRVRPQRRVVWNQEFLLPLKVVNGLVNQDGVWLRLFHRTSSGNPQLIGEVYFSFAELTRSFTKAVIRGERKDKEKPGDRVAPVAMLKPRYFNMYGPEKGPIESSRKGVAYRGRVLIGAASKRGSLKEAFLRPCPPPPRPRLALYQVEFQVSRATELPLPPGWMVAVEVRAGLYSFGHTIPRVTARNSCVQWDEGSLVRVRNLRFPEDIKQVPDFFVTLWTRKPKTVPLLEEQGDESNRSSLRSDKDEHWSPFAFIRLPPSHLILPHSQPKWMFMDYPGDNVLVDGDRVPGSLLFRCNLSLMGQDMSEETARIDRERTVYAQGIKRSEIQASARLTQKPTFRGPDAALSTSGTFSPPKGEEKLYELRALILQGRNLPAADPNGLSDPFVVVSIGDQSRKGAIICKQTVSPLWKETIVVSNISLRQGERRPNVNILVYDWDEDNEFDYLGRAIVPSSEIEDDEPQVEDARWYPVFSVNPEAVVGEILADFQLVEQQRAITVPSPTVMPSATKSCLRISLIGLRDVKFLRYATGNMFCELSISGDSIQPVRSKRGGMLQTGSYQANCNILDVLLLDVNVPDDLRLAPSLNIYVYAEYSHRSSPEMIATACVRMGKWLNGFESRCLMIEELSNDQFGTREPIPVDLVEKGYKFVPDAMIKRSKLLLNEVQSTRKVAAQEKAMESLDLDSAGSLALVLPSRLRRGYPEMKTTKFTELMNTVNDKVSQIQRDIAVTLAHARQSRHAVVATIFDLMPDVAMRLGVPEPGEELLLTETTPEDDRQDSSATSTVTLRGERGFCPHELEMDFLHPSYGEFILRRGDSRTFGTLDGAPVDSQVEGGPGEARLVRQEMKRAQLEGKSPAVGKVKVRLDLVNADMEDEMQLQRARMISLRSFGKVFVPTEVIARVYILRGIGLQQVGNSCDSYITVSFFGGFPNFYSTKHRPVRHTDNPEYYEMFESRVKMPGGSVKIEVKDRMMPEVNLPLKYPWLTKDDGDNFPHLGLASKELTLSTDTLGLGWSESIGETTIDLDSRWYNSAWRSLEKTPLEIRSLWKGDSLNLKGKLELFVDIISVGEFESNPKVHRPLPITQPVPERYMLRVVIFNTENALLPYQKEPINPNRLASFYVECRLGNKKEDIRRTDNCRYSADGQGQFNWRMSWWVTLPDPSLQPRLKVQVFDDTSRGLGNDDLCATCDIKMRTMFDEMVSRQKPILKKKQWVLLMGHPDHPGVQARCQLAIEFIPERAVLKKKCMDGSESYNIKQHPDYVLPRPFRPAAFSLFNPVPFINYQVANTIKSLSWALSTYLLPFAFLPMLFQFLWQTPWWWYFMSGVAGLVVMLRIVLVEMGRASAVAEAELAAAREEEELGDEDDFAEDEKAEGEKQEAIDPADEEVEERALRLKREAEQRARKELMRTHTGLEVGLSRPVNLR